jgi:hypothetical protein
MEPAIRRVASPLRLSRRGRGEPRRSIPLASSLKGRGPSHQGRGSLRRQSQVIVGSCGFPVVLREPGTRRATTSRTSPSRPFRPHVVRS